MKRWDEAFLRAYVEEGTAETGAGRITWCCDPPGRPAVSPSVPRRLAIRSAGPLPDPGYLWTGIGHFPETGRPAF